MKWLASTILCVLTTGAFAQTEGITQIPSSLFCGQTDPEHIERLKDEYGELPFVEGDGEVMSPNPRMSYQGTVTMYYDPIDLSYSVFIDLPGDLTCLVVTGERLEPVVEGDDI